MSPSKSYRFIILLLAWNVSSAVAAESATSDTTPLPLSSLMAQDDVPADTEESPPPPIHSRPAKKVDSRHYFTDTTPRTDAGVFHVGFAVGGNFYIEPQFDSSTGQATGDYFKNLGGQGGVYFDYDYSEVAENIPLMLRGMIGYKYILADGTTATHVGAFDGMVRYMWRFSEGASFGAGLGGSAAVWYRIQSTESNEEVVFLPSLLLGAGFEFNPFMVDFKWLINRIGADSTIMGFELYFGFRI
jgi:hypothetical protein